MIAGEWQTSMGIVGDAPAKNVIADADLSEKTTSFMKECHGRIPQGIQELTANPSIGRFGT